MRTIVRNAIITDPALLGMGVTPNGTLSGDVDTPQERPFLNLKWGTRSPSVMNAAPTVTTLAIWVHDNPSDYSRIDRILSRLRAVLTALEGVVMPDGSEVQVITWLSDGPDLQDDGHRTIVKVGNYQVVGKA